MLPSKVPKRPIRGSGWRVSFFIVGVFLVLGLAIYRLFNLALVNHTSFLKTAISQQEGPSASISNRGSIYFSDFSTSGRNIVATNKSSTYLYSNNKILDVDPAQISSKLFEIIKTDPAEIEKKLSQKDKSYQVLAVDLTNDQAEKIKNLKIKGINTTSQTDRFYPLGTSAAHIFGFVGSNGKDRTGQYGLEAFYEDVLKSDSKPTVLDAYRVSGWGTETYDYVLNLFGVKKKSKTKTETVARSEAQEGSDIILSIDKNIQSLVETKLEQTLKRWQSPSGLIIVEDPKSGSILAMASSPSFDPNHYGDYSFENFINPVNQQVYEPGSSFKPVTMSAAIDTHSVKPETTYNDTGEFTIAGKTIKNFDEKSRGIQTMREVLEKSLNTGAIFAQQKTGDDNFLNYVVAFGFGQKTGIDLGGEISGNISNLYSGREINFVTSSFGQGIAVTPIQLINAYSAIANNGKLMRPHLAAKIVHPDGSQTDIKLKIIGSPITEATARTLQSMLVDVVDKGFDRARIQGYDVAGKTGTAQIPAPDGGYLGNDQFIHNFVGFAPAYNARFTILIKMDRPKGIKFAADSLSPVFGDIARYLIRYFNIPPTRK